MKHAAASTCCTVDSTVAVPGRCLLQLPDLSGCSGIQSYIHDGHCLTSQLAVKFTASLLALDNHADTSLSAGLTGLEDALTRILHSLLPADLQSVLLLMAKLVPRTLEGLLLYALTPAAAEVLTQKLEAVSADQGDPFLAVVNQLGLHSAAHLQRLRMKWLY